MATKPQDYFRYLVDTPELNRWGLGITAAGVAHIPPGAAYPPHQHPADHYFSWTQGRKLNAYQILLVTAGRGWFESAATGLRAVEAGNAFLLFPRVWHRYRPDSTTGWTESWIEFKGPLVDGLRRSKILQPSRALRLDTISIGLDANIEAIHARVRLAPLRFDPELSARALSALAAWQTQTAGRASPARSRLSRAVAEAEQYLSAHLAEPIDIPELCRHLGVAYSHFRRVFKLHTGFAPWQYVLQQRLVRARRLISSSDCTLQDAADQLGFSSAFHLSAAFKQAYGISPDRWRRRYVAEATATEPATVAPPQR